MRKILIAIDGSENALRAVRHAGKSFYGCPDVRVTLFHVLPYIPAEFWDDGHILTEDEKKTRKGVVDKWLSNQTLRLDPIFAEAKKILASEGVEENRVETKWISDSSNAADSIIEEARNGGYLTIVIGRCGHAAPKKHIGTTTESVLSQGAGVTISVVD